MTKREPRRQPLSCGSGARSRGHPVHIPHQE